MGSSNSVYRQTTVPSPVSNSATVLSNENVLFHSTDVLTSKFIGFEFNRVSRLHGQQTYALNSTKELFQQEAFSIIVVDFDSLYEGLLTIAQIKRLFYEIALDEKQPAREPCFIGIIDDIIVDSKALTAESIACNFLVKRSNSIRGILLASIRFLEERV